MIAAYIAWTGLHLVRRAMGGLMDQQDRDDHTLLVRILDAHQSVESPARICSYHKLRHRHTGRYHWVDFHIRVPAMMSVRDGHTIATFIEEEIEAAIGEGNATAHIEPCGDAACPRCSGPGAA